MLFDLRYAFRMLFRKPAMPLIAICTLGLGIGALATTFSVMDALLLRPLPFPEADRLVLLREVGATGGTMAVAEPNFEDVKARSSSFRALALAGGGDLAVTGGSEAVRTRVSYVSQQFFDVMGVRPIVGRTFLPEETKYPGPAAVLVSYGFWKRQLNGNVDLQSMSLRVDGASCAVVGVLPAGFSYPGETEVWITSSVEPPNTSRTAHNWPIIGRLRDSVTIEQARADVSLIAQQLRETHGASMSAVDFTLIPLQQYLTRNVRAGLLLLLGAAGLLLLVACANVSNLLLTRATARHREFTIRLALGISRWRFVQLLLAENLLVTLPAAAIGALLASYGVDLLLSLDPGKLPRINAPVVDGRVLLFAMLLSLLIAVTLAVLTAWRFGSRELQDSLRQAGPSLDGSSVRIRHGLAVSQIALTLILLTGAGLLAHSFLKLVRTDPGFQSAGAVVMTLALPSTISRDEDERIRQFYVQLLDRLGGLPGVSAVGGINALPLDGARGTGSFLIDNDDARRAEAGYRVASAGYFAAMNVKLLQGRLFGSEDTVNSPHAAVISQSLARRYWANGDAIGKRIQFGNMDTDRRLLHIVGIVSDVRDSGLDADVGRTVYSYSLQRPQWWQVSRLSIVVRSASAPEHLVPEMRRAVNELRADVPLTFRTLDEVFASSLDERRFSLVLFGVFALVALLISTIGVYGVMSYGVAQRTQEIGIRMALGAQRADVLGLVVGQGIKLTLAGLALGLLGSFALTRLMRSLVVGISVTDPLTFAAVSLLLALIAVMASYVPARRATKVDPLVALRHE
ncbi:MAG: ABC transporter permease [Acidobacteriota bacterium]